MYYPCNQWGRDIMDYNMANEANFQEKDEFVFKEVSFTDYDTVMRLEEMTQPKKKIRSINEQNSL